MCCHLLTFYLTDIWKQGCLRCWKLLSESLGTWGCIKRQTRQNKQLNLLTACQAAGEPRGARSLGAATLELQRPRGAPRARLDLSSISSPWRWISASRACLGVQEGSDIFPLSVECVVGFASSLEIWCWCPCYGSSTLPMLLFCMGCKPTARGSLLLPLRFLSPNPIGSQGHAVSSFVSFWTPFPPLLPQTLVPEPCEPWSFWAQELRGGCGQGCAPLTQPGGFAVGFTASVKQQYFRAHNKTSQLYQQQALWVVAWLLLNE